jgi:23S rRNA (cytosine1962-C5)-methyltransferase
MNQIILKPGREKSILRYHPWIFSGAVQLITGKPVLGETVDVVSSEGNFLAKAAINQNSNIIARIWSWSEDEAIDSYFIHQKVERAVASRNNLLSFLQTNAIRLVHGESDGLPGLILDRYEDTYVIQCLSAGIEYWKDEIARSILELTNAKVLFERSDVDVRQLEGLELKKGLLFGELPIETISIYENGLNFYVDIVNGHKTGLYLDQRDNRVIIRQLAAGKKVLDCFCYTGGFSLNCLIGNADSITMVESSNMAMSWVSKNILLNNLNVGKVEMVETDVFHYLRKLRDKGESYDLVILDPPKFAPTAAHVGHATRGYKDINLLALKLLRPGGFLVTFSCSGGISEELFQKILSGAAIDAGVEAKIVRRLYQACDHPVALNFPEGAYLKGFIIQKEL